MKPLSETFTVRGERGWTFTIVRRTGDVVLVAKTRADMTRTAYEVAIVQKHDTYTVHGSTVEAHEALPGAEAFGRLAWAPPTLDAAAARFDALVAARSGDGATGPAPTAADAPTGQIGPNVPVFDAGAP